MRAEQISGPAPRPARHPIRTWSGPHGRPEAGLLALQSAAGNLAVSQLLSIQRDGPTGGSAPPIGGTAGDQAIASIRQQRWGDALRLLNGQAMPQLLDALEAVRGAQLLTPLADHVDQTGGISTARTWAAILAVQLHLGSRFGQFLRTLPDDQQSAIRHHAFERIMAGGAPDVLRRSSDGAVFSEPVPLTNVEWAARFLTFFGFGAPPIRDDTGQACVFNSRAATLTDVLDTLMEQASLAGYLIERDEVAPVAARQREESRGPARSAHFTITYSFVPWTGHVDPSSGATSRDQPGHQLGGTFTFQLHHDDEPGWELSVVANVTFFADEGGAVRLQNVQAGGQAAWVVPFARGFLQAGPFLQVVGGAAYRQHTIDGAMQVTTDPAAQGTIGGQMLLVVPGTNRHLMVGVQGGGSLTGASAPSGRAGPVHDQPSTTFDASGNVFLQWQF
jgi:hypothetical protein